MSGIMQVLMSSRKVVASTITFVASALGTASTTSSVTVDKPTGTASGDLMIFIGAGANSDKSWTQASGWTEIADKGSIPSPCVQYRVATSADDSVSSYSFSGTFSGNKFSGIILTYRNAVYDTIGAFGTGTSGGNCTAPAITVAADNSVLLAFFFIDAESGSFPTPSGMTLVNSTTWLGQPTAFSQSVNAGSTGDRSSDHSLATDTPAGILMSIKPA